MASSLSFLLSFCSTLTFLGVCSFLLFFGLLWSFFAASLWPVPLWLPLFSLLGANCAPAPFVCALFCLGLAVLGCALLHGFWCAKSAPALRCFVHFDFECASCHNGVQFFTSHPPKWLCTRRFSQPTFDPPEPQNIRKT